jgi:amino acid adenylation domain-containing protein
MDLVRTLALRIVNLSMDRTLHHGFGRWISEHQFAFRRDLVRRWLAPTDEYHITFVDVLLAKFAPALSRPAGLGRIETEIRPDDPLADEGLALADRATGLPVSGPVEVAPPAAPGAPPEPTLVAHFEAQVALAPDAVALVYEGGSLSYAQLDEAANRLAHHLIGRGVGPEDLVGIALGRSVEMFVAVLGALKAGAGYLPLDPTIPRQRLQFMIEDAAPACILSAAGWAGSLGDAASVVLLDDPAVAASLRAQPGTAPVDGERRAPLGARNVAYIVYTSGSTGTPKGVVTTHANVVSLAWRPDYAPLAAGQAVLQFAPLAFDAATFEIWGALLNGARLVVAPPGLDLDRLTATILDNQVDTLWLTASLFRQVAETHPQMFGRLRRLLIGGEALPVVAVRKVMARYPALNIVNGYGPTETTTFACTRLITRADAESDAIPIGAPLRGLRAYVLDAAMSPAPAGTEGELFIAGDGVARGYLNRDDLTSARFLPCPFEGPGARMYRTGDLVRWRPDGALDFLGRADQQVKIRGFRIEPGEIETALLSVDGIGQAAVAPWRIGEETRLAAYLVACPGRTVPDIATLRSALSIRLPDYMLPAAFITLDALPLTANGKLDHKALPPPQRGSGQDMDRPEGEVERRLAELFCRCLDLESVGATDNFFELGGDSLLGLRLALEIETALGRKVSLGVLFAAPTVRQLAQALDHAEAEPAQISVVPLHTNGSRAPVFIVHWIEREFARHLAIDRPVYGLSFGLSGATADYRPLHPDSIEDLAAHYIQEMRSVQPSGPYHLVGHSVGGLVAYEMAQQLTVERQPVALLALLDVRAPEAPARPEGLPLKRQLETLLRTPIPRLFRRATEFFHTWLVMIQPVNQRLLISPTTSVAHRIQLAVLLMRKYRPKPYDGYFHFFKANAGTPGLRSGLPPRLELGWLELARGGLEIHEIAASHEEMVKGPFAAEIGSTIEEALKREGPGQRPPGPSSSSEAAGAFHPIEEGGSVRD